MHPVLILLYLSRRACEGIAQLLRASSTKIDAIIAVLDGMAYHEFRLSTLVKAHKKLYTP
jgi:hypothetical protein